MKRDDAHHVLRRPMKQAAAAACCAGNGEDSTFPPGLRKVWGETRGCNITTLCFLRPSSLTLLCLIYTAVSHSLPLLNHSLILPLRALTSPSSYLPYPSLSLSFLLIQLFFLLLALVTSLNLIPCLLFMYLTRQSKAYR